MLVSIPCVSNSWGLYECRLSSQVLPLKISVCCGSISKKNRGRGIGPRLCRECEEEVTALCSSCRSICAAVRRRCHSPLEFSPFHKGNVWQLCCTQAGTVLPPFHPYGDKSSFFYYFLLLWKTWLLCFNELPTIRKIFVPGAMWAEICCAVACCTCALHYLKTTVQKHRFVLAF